MQFALNHIAVPNTPLPDFFAMARDLGMTRVEIRNDLPDILGQWSPEDVRAQAEQAGVTIISVNALYPFNVWTDDLGARAQAMARYAAACGAQSLVLCPLNDGRRISFDELVGALQRMRPILDRHGLTGLVEPLGFPVSSLRSKVEAIRAIEAAGGEATYRLVHDTFHHHLAGETQIFPEWTGLVHISGVVDPDLAVDDMLDGHRVLVDGADRLDNTGQISALIRAGYDGPFSFEPFAPEIHNHPDPKAAIAGSIDHLRASL